MPRSEDVSVVVSIDSSFESQLLAPRLQPLVELIDATPVEYIDGNAQFSSDIRVNIGSGPFSDGPISNLSNGGELVIHEQSLGSTIDTQSFKHGDLIFNVAGGQQVIRITAGGDFYVCDRLVTNDKDIYWAFKRFMEMALGDHPVPTPVELRHMIPLSKDGIPTRSERVLEEISRAQDTPRTAGSGT